MIVCCGFVVCWSANEIVYFLRLIGYRLARDNWFSFFSTVMVKVNSCINPFIYAAKYAEFQNGVRRMIARLTGNPQNIEGGHVVSGPINQQTRGNAVT